MDEQGKSVGETVLGQLKHAVEEAEHILGIGAEPEVGGAVEGEPASSVTTQAPDSSGASTIAAAPVSSAADASQLASGVADEAPKSAGGVSEEVSAPADISASDVTQPAAVGDQGSTDAPSNGIGTQVPASIAHAGEIVDALKAAGGAGWVAELEADVERAREGVARIRAHLWTFAGDAVKHLHEALDTIEKVL